MLPQSLRSQDCRNAFDREQQTPIVLVGDLVWIDKVKKSNSKHEFKKQQGEMMFWPLLNKLI